MHQRLDDDRGQLSRVGLDRRARLVGPTRVGVAGRPHDGEAQRVERSTEDAAVAERERADGVAVVRIAEREEARAALNAAVDPVLERDLERLFDGDRAIRSKEEVGVVDRHHRSEGFRQLDDNGVAVAQHGRVGDLARLGHESSIELGDAVAEGVDPQ